MSIVRLVLLLAGAASCRSWWTSTPRLPADGERPVRFTLALKERNIDELKRWALAVSDPRSPHT